MGNSFHVESGAVFYRDWELSSHDIAIKKIGRYFQSGDFLFKGCMISKDNAVKMAKWILETAGQTEEPNEQY